MNETQDTSEASRAQFSAALAELQVEKRDLPVIQEELEGCLEKEQPGRSDLDQEGLLTAQLLAYRIKEIADRAEAKKSQTPDEPLVLMVGEIHTASAHVILPAFLAMEMQARGYKVAAGWEKEHNYIVDIFKIWARSKGRQITESVSAETMQRLTDQITLLEILLNPPGYLYPYAPYSEQFSAFLLNTHGVSMAFNDAASFASGNKYLDLTDDETHSIARQVLDVPSLDPLDKIHREKEKGMHIRNHFMAKSRRMHMDETGPDIYISSYGGLHIGGWVAGRKYPYEHSALALATDAGENVLAVPLLHQSFSLGNIPHQAQVHPDLMAGQRLSTRTFHIDLRKLAEDGGDDIVSDIIARELMYLDALAARMGVGECFAPFLEAQDAASKKTERIFEEEWRCIAG